MSKFDFGPIAADYPAPAGNDPAESAWYLYVGVVLESTGEVGFITELWRYLATTFPSRDVLLRVARRLREALLKTSVLVGFPRGINALAALRATINEQNPDLGRELEADRSQRENLTMEQLKQRGYDFFHAVYGGSVADKVKDNMAKSSGGDLPHFAILSVYGELMAETRLISAKQTGLLEFTACYVTLAVPQATGHMYGSRNLGNSKEEIQAAIRLVRATMAAVGREFDDSKMTFVQKMDKW